MLGMSLRRDPRRQRIIAYIVWYVPLWLGVQVYPWVYIDSMCVDVYVEYEYVHVYACMYASVAYYSFVGEAERIALDVFCVCHIFF